MPTTLSDLQRAADAYREALEAGVVASVDRQAAAYARVLERVELDIQLLVYKITAARDAGVEPSPAWAYQQGRLAAFTETLAAEVRRWAPLAEAETRRLAYDAADSAQGHAQALVADATEWEGRNLVASFVDLNPENMATILGHLAPTGPLSDLVASFAGDAAQSATDALVQGLVLGKGTDWIATELRKAADLPRWRAETIARTEALRAYRETSRLTYRQTQVTTGWVWYSALDRRTCPACVVMHGREFSLDEQLDGHPRCRCAMLPIITTSPVLVNGERWLEQQSPAVQRGILGPLKYDAWTKGEATLPDFVARTSSPKWGTMRRERSMAEVREGRNADHRDRGAA